MGQWATASALIATYRSYYSIIYFSPHTHLTQITVVSSVQGLDNETCVVRHSRPVESRELIQRLARAERLSGLREAWVRLEILPVAEAPRERHAKAPQ